MAQRKFFKQYEYGSVFIYDLRGDDATIKRKKITWTVLTIFTFVPLGILVYLKFLSALGKETGISPTLLIVLMVVFFILFFVAVVFLSLASTRSWRLEVNISTKVCKVGKKKIPFSNIKKIILSSMMYEGESVGEKKPGETAVGLQMSEEDGEPLEAFDDLETAEEFANELNRFLKVEIEKEEIEA